MMRPAAGGLPAAAALVVLLLLLEALPVVSSQEPGKGEEANEADKHQGPMFESMGNMVEELKEVWQDLVRKVRGWFSGHAKETGAPSEDGGGADAGGEGAGVSEREAFSLPLLSSFCGLEVQQDQAIDCSCCADHLLASRMEAAGLLYGGHVEDQGPAFHRNDSAHSEQIGRVRVWSLGNRIPSVWCDRGRPICHCEDSLQAWCVSEPACHAGGPCAPSEEPEEYSSSPRSDTAPEQPPGTAGCAGEGPTRIPIGSARCEDMSVRQCSQLYAKGEKGWHYCEVDAKAVRTCGARLASAVPQKSEADDRSKMWAVQLAYSPDLNWTVLEREDHTFRVAGDPMPPAEEVRAILKRWGQSPQLRQSP